MTFRYDYPDGVWIDLEQPTEEEIHEVARAFSISERLETELLYPTPSPLVANDPSTALLVLHFPEHGEVHGETKSQEIDLVVGAHFIITVRYEVIAPLHRLKKLLETESVVDGTAAISTDVLLEIIFAHLYTSVRDHTSHSADVLARVERDMFGGHERTTVRAISTISREFLHLESALANQEEPLARFLRTLSERSFFGPSFAERTTRILAERIQIAHLVRTHRAVATELRETNSALLESRQNEIMKTLTMITVVVLPLELIAFVFGMHVPGTPLDQNSHAFWIIMAVMLAAVGFMTVYFARKRWF
ncbi:MAG TPA: CorA family divalent cation transporter [Candidatus Paceibacterota bacterium]|nr:CorA family divalent cation transporter [Candidatus Paceibacterota bacterium]